MHIKDSQVCSASVWARPQPDCGASRSIPRAMEAAIITIVFLLVRVPLFKAFATTSCVVDCVDVIWYVR